MNIYYKKAADEEIKSYRYLYENIPDAFIKNRIEGSFTYYIEMAVKYKYVWNLFTMLSIILPAAATLISVFVSQDDRTSVCVIAFITFLTTVTSGLSAAFKVPDKKSSYRNLAENIKGELAMYHGKVGAYKGKKDSEATRILYQNIEKIIQDGYNKISSLEDNKGQQFGGEASGSIDESNGKSDLSPDDAKKNECTKE